MKTITPIAGKPASQKGSVLLISLIVLVLLSLLAISSMNSTSLEERMASNTHEYTLSFDATEAALNDAEVWLQNVQVAPDTTGTAYHACTPITATTLANPTCQGGWVTPSCITTGACSFAYSGLATCDGNSNQTLWDTTITKGGPAEYCDLSASWWQNYGTPLGTATTVRNLPTISSSSQPRYIVEFLQAQAVNPSPGWSGNPIAFTDYYQITARGLAVGNVATTIAQATYAINK